MISLQASDIFFCIRYDYLQDQNSAGSLFKGPMFCTLYAFLPALRFVQNVWKAVVIGATIRSNQSERSKNFLDQSESRI